MPKEAWQAWLRRTRHCRHAALPACRHSRHRQGNLSQPKGKKHPVLSVCSATFPCFLLDSVSVTLANPADEKGGLGLGGRRAVLAARRSGGAHAAHAATGAGPRREAGQPARRRTPPPAGTGAAKRAPAVRRSARPTVPLRGVCPLTGGDRGGHPSDGWSRWGWGSHPRCGRS